jgi:hypothetical protein
MERNQAALTLLDIVIGDDKKAALAAAAELAKMTAWPVEIAGGIGNCRAVLQGKWGVAGDSILRVSAATLRQQWGDLTAIPDEDLKSEWGRRTQARRKTKGAGPGRPRKPILCIDCGVPIEPYSDPGFIGCCPQCGLPVRRRIKTKT